MMSLEDLERGEEKSALLMMTMHLESLTKDLFGAGTQILSPLQIFKHSLLHELSGEYLASAGQVVEPGPQSKGG